MNHTRVDISGGSSARQTAAAPAKAGRGDKGQKVKLVVAVALLVVAGGVIAYSFIGGGSPKPPPAEPAQLSGDPGSGQSGGPSGEQPVGQSNGQIPGKFNRVAQPVKPN